jgi:hypothetical protein
MGKGSHGSVWRYKNIILKVPQDRIFSYKDLGGKGIDYHHILCTLRILADRGLVELLPKDKEGSRYDINKYRAAGGLWKLQAKMEASGE